MKNNCLQIQTGFLQCSWVLQQILNKHCVNKMAGQIGMAFPVLSWTASRTGGRRKRFEGKIIDDWIIVLMYVYYCPNNFSIILKKVRTKCIFFVEIRSINYGTLETDFIFTVFNHIDCFVINYNVETFIFAVTYNWTGQIFQMLQILRHTQTEVCWLGVKDSDSQQSKHSQIAAGFNNKSKILFI